MKTLQERLENAVDTTIVTESNNWGGLSDEQQEIWNDWWDQYVPDEGKANNVGGEIMRAMSRLVYRFYNDGDTVDNYGGSEFNILIGADRYLRDTLKGNIYTSMEDVWQENKYEKLLIQNMASIFKYLQQNQNLFSKRNNEDYQDLGEWQRHEWDDDEDEDLNW